jgi:alpha-D-ribose 1-methylphosphonate 5-triphosphate synthase subunit PhnH
VLDPVLHRGFPDPVPDAQAVFRTVLAAMAAPGTIAALPGGRPEPPPPLTPALAALALTLADHDTPVWLDARLGAAPAVAAYLRFQTGAPVVDDPGRAHFAFALGLDRLPALAAFAQGSHDYPDRSTTLVLSLAALGDGDGLLLSGPGIKQRATLRAAPLSDGFVAALAGNHARFPRGVDCILVAGGKLAGLPRSTRVERE